MKNPMLGHSRSDIKENYRAYKVERHLVIYSIKEDKIYVIAILHDNMDFTKLSKRIN